MTAEEELIQGYIDAFNRHDIDAVMACFLDDVVVVRNDGTRVEGRDDVREYYEGGFAMIPDGRCDLQTAIGRDGRGVAESVFRGTLRNGAAVVAVGAEVMEMAGGKIKEIRDYHRGAS